MTDTLKVALIGYGYAGSKLHAPLIKSVGELKLVGIYSNSAEKVWADLPDVTVSARMDNLLEQTNADLVVIATPNVTHFPLAKEALLAGKHVVVDKPFTLDTAQARELTALAKKRGLFLSIFQNRRWDADFLSVREVISADKLGELHSFESRFERYRPVVRSRWREQAGDGSGLWYDLGPHLLDQVLQLFGPPLAIHADFTMQRQRAEAIDYFHVLLRYSKLRVILHASMLSANERPRFVLSGQKGSYTKFGTDLQEDALKLGKKPGNKNWGVDPLDGTLHLDTPLGLQSHSVPNARGDYRLYYQGVCDAILRGAPNPVPPEDAVLGMQLLELAELSATLRSEQVLGATL